MKLMNEELEVVAGVAPQDIGTANVTGDYLPMSGADQILATFTTEALTTGKIGTVELLQATDSSGTGTKALAAAVSGTSVDSGAVTVSVGVKSDDFDTNNDFNHYAVKVTIDEAGKLGAATVARGHLRYSV